MWKWILGVLLVLAASCIGGGLLLESTGKLKELRANFDPQSKPVTVRFGIVERGDVVRVVSAPGQIEPKTKVEISAQVSARIIALPFREGAVVKANDVVCRLDSRDLAANLTSAQAQLKSEEARLESAKAALANASLERGRSRELFATKDIAKAELDAAELAYARSLAELGVALQAIEIARANIDRAQEDLSRTTIIAPFDGVITTLDAEVGELVVVGTLNTPGSVFMTISDLTTMLVKARIDEANIAKVATGQRARVDISAYDGITFTGIVEHVGLTRKRDTDGTAYYEADVILDPRNDIQLRTGLTASVDIEVEVLRDVLKVVSQAIVERRVDELPADVGASSAVDRKRGFARVIYVARNGVAKPVAVRTGAVDLTHTVILEGITQGETVITGPFKVLMDLRTDRLVKSDVPASDAATGTVIGGQATNEPKLDGPTSDDLADENKTNSEPGGGGSGGGGSGGGP